MNTKIFNVAFLLLWLSICIGLLTRDLWMPPDLLERVSGPNTPLMIAITALLALWNLMRLLVAYRFPTQSVAKPSPEVQEYRRRIRAKLGDDPRVTDPQFNFDDPPPEGKQ
jgi:hypothetical protein